MAKGRKLTTSRSERYLGSHTYGHSRETSTTDAPELAEDDVWSLVDGMVNGDDHVTPTNGSRGGGWSPRSSSEGSNGSLSMRSSRRRVPRGDVHAGGLSLAFDDPGKAASPRIVHQFRGPDSFATPGGRHVASSAPVNVPDWTKIYRVDSVESMHDSDDGCDDYDLEMVPPHEYLARSRKAAANSVFEGVGRTLKGRDMSRVRDAVWSQTGFDG